MDITVVGADGLPDKAYLSIRAGEVRKQVQFKPGVVFDLKTAPRHFVVDVFEKVSSKQVSLADLQGLEDGTDAARSVLELAGRGGSPINLDMKFKVRDPNEDESLKKSPKRLSRHQAALEAKSYLDGCGVQKVLQGMVHELLSRQPSDAVGFMTSYLQDLTAKGLVPQASPPPAAGTTPSPGWSQRPGFGEEELDGFPVDGSADLPDLTKHHSVVATVLKKDPSLYSQLQAVHSSTGLSLAKCVKPGVDNKGHPMVRTVGLVAGDTSCFEVFKDVFDPVIRQLHADFAEGSPHLTELDASGVSDLPLDAAGSRVVAVQVHGSRCLTGLQMPTAASQKELSEAERLLTSALSSLAGAYHPLRGSGSHTPEPGDVQFDLRASGFLFDEPDSAIMLSAGYGRHWPCGRGVFVGEQQDFFAWVNEVDHLKIFSRQPGGDLKQAFERFVRVERSVCESLKASNICYASSGRLGFLNSCPSNLGTALHVSATLRIPLLGGYGKEFKALCRRLRLQARARQSAPAGSVVLEDGDLRGLWELSNHIRLGCSEVVQVNSMISACREITAVEARLEAGEDPAVVLAQAVGPPVESSMPDLTGKHSMAADVLRADPGIYERLKALKTPMGVTLETCIKTCFENSGHPMIKTIGAVAGDALCYETFKDFFGPVIKLRHPNWNPAKGHSTDLDWGKVTGDPLDPDAAGRVASVRVRLTRNLHGICMPPACSLEERREVEKAMAQALGQLKGEYFPLRGSSSYSPKPGGMSVEEEEHLEAEHLLFDEPDSQVLLSSGFGRDWPDARGVFVGEDRRLLVWVNESDHLRMQAMQEGSDLKGVFGRLCKLLADMEAALQTAGHSFARSGGLGFLGACPSNLGTCLAASAIIRIPLLSAEPQFRALCRRLRLQAHLGIGSGLTVAEGVWEVLNIDRLGTSEVEQVDAVIAGCRVLLQAESKLERGEALEPLPAELGPPPAAMEDPLGEENGEWDEEPGLGEEEFPGFPANACPEELPSLVNHHSLMASVLKGDPAIYERLKGLKTKMDVSLARCIKTGMDNLGHPMITTVGVVAGDAECYDLFGELFDTVIKTRHPGFDPACDSHAGGLDERACAAAPGSLDPVGGYVKSVQVSVDRNLQSLPFPPAASEEERIATEKAMTAALLRVPGLGGDYHPLRGSGSYAGKPDDMSEEMEAMLAEKGLLIEAPDSNVVLAAGTGKHWPKARGIFLAEEGRTVAFLNQDSHLKLRCSRSGDDLKGAVARLCEVERGVTEGLQAESLQFARSARLGHLTASPSDLGTAMHVDVLVWLPLLPRQPKFKDLCQRCKVLTRAGPEGSGKGYVYVTNSQTLGSTEADQVGDVVRAVAHLVSLEAELTQGKKVDLEAPLPELDPVESLRAEAREMLLKGMNEGTLEKALEGANEVGIQDVRLRARKALEQAADDGRLEVALSDIVPSEDFAVGAPHGGDSLEKEKARGALLQALDEGRLDAAIESALAADSEAEMDNVDQMRDRARSALSGALQSGQLEEVLRTIMPTMQEAEFSEDTPGLGSADVPGFPADVCPESLPDLTGYCSIVAAKLREKPAIYESLRGLSTKRGVSLARCIKPGLDSKGHPMVKTLGLVAGDEECFEVFKDLFDPVLAAKHAGFDPSDGSTHPAGFGVPSTGGAPLDPSGKVVISASVQAGRNIKDLCFLPAASRQQRLEAEKLCVGALQSLGGDLAGVYTPLASMGQAAKASLEANGLLFDKPDSPLTLSSGFGRHWPEARGVFANEAHTLAAWVNQEDHLLIFSSEPGALLHEAFERFARVEGALQEALQLQGHGYARSQALGCLAADPSKAGSGGFQAKVQARLVRVSAQADFKAVCKSLKVAVKEAEEPGVWSISKAGILGQCEAEVLDTVAAACQKLVEMEVALEKGEGSS